MDKEGDLDLKNLNFGGFEGDILISKIKCKGVIDQSEHRNDDKIYQFGHENEGDIDQYGHANQGDIDQSSHQNEGYIEQDKHANKGNIYQGEHQNIGNISQGYHENIGNIDQSEHKNEGDIDQYGHRNKYNNSDKLKNIQIIEERIEQINNTIEGIDDIHNLNRHSWECICDFNQFTELQKIKLNAEKEILMQEANILTKIKRKINDKNNISKDK